MKRTLLRDFGIIIIATACASQASSQSSSHWKKIGQLPINSSGEQRRGGFGYFFSPERGLVFGAGSDGGIIYYTNNGGVTWDSSSNFTGGGTWGGRMLMVNDSTGWLTGPGTWRTIDSGKSWIPFNPANGGGPDLYVDLSDSVRFLNHAGAISELSDSIWITTMDGPPNDPTGGSYFGHTTNGGMTWSYTPSYESSGIYASPSWHLIFSGHEIGLPVISTDSGITWSEMTQYPNIRTTGDVEGGRQAVYMQSWWNSYGSPLSLYRTMDFGKTWVSIGGPSNDLDTRFFVIDCNGAEVVAFDHTGGIWLTTDGGDGAIQPESAHPKFSSDPVTVFATLCTNTTSGFRFYNDDCDSIIILGVSILDSNSLAMTTGAFGFDSIPSLPLTMLPGVEDSIGFHWRPSGIFSSDTTISLRLDFRYFSRSLDATNDTIITLKLVVNRGTIGDSLSAYSVNFEPTSTCSFTDSILTITNIGCLPITIDSVTIAGDGFTLLSFDTIIANSKSGNVLFRYNPSFANQTSGTLSIYIDEQGLHIVEMVALNGMAIQGEGILDVRSTKLQAGSFSFCTGDTTITDTISNTGCDTLVISNINFSGDTTFSLVSASGDSLLLPGSSRVFQFTFAPRVKGAQSATLTFHSRNIVNDPGHDTAITLSGLGLGGTKLPEIHPSEINFGTTTICEERDSSVTIANAGCDTIHIFSSSFSSFQFAFDTTYQFPIILPPDSSITFPIFTHLDTAGHPATINGTLQFTLDSGVSVPNVLLTRAVAYPPAFSLSLTAQASAAIQATLPVYVLRIGTIPAKADEVDFDLIYNNDLLSFNNALQPDITPLSQTTLANGMMDRSFKMQPATDRDTIASLQFQTYLTKTDTTTIQLAHQQFVASGEVSPGCVAIMDTASTPSNFTLELGCVDSLLIADLNDAAPFSIESIQPNPAKNEITVTLSGAPQPTVEMYDALGRVQDVRSTSLPTGVVVDVSGVPSGSYIMRVSDGEYVQSRRVVIQH